MHADKSSRNDLSINEIACFRKLEKAFLSRCGQFGYNEIKTSTIESLYIFTAKGVLSDAKLKRIYSFIDWDGWSGERVALRPDSSPCVARFYNENLRNKNIKQKLCYVENHFEWGDSGDEISERWQCGIENIGSKEPESDIEAVYIACDIIKEIGFENFYLYLSYPFIIKEMISVIAPNNKKEIITALKNNPADIQTTLSKFQDGEKLLNLLTLKGKSVNCLINLKHSLQDVKYKKVYTAFENLICICKLLDDLKCSYIIDFSFLGNLEYYTGMSFQILSTSARKNNRNVLCSGGRYDNLIGNMGNLPESVPATGFALYVRNILNLSCNSMDEIQNIRICIENITKHNVKIGQSLCGKLLRFGFKAQIIFNSIKTEKYDNFDLIISVDSENLKDGYKILHSRKIGKPLLVHLFGEIND